LIAIFGAQIPADLRAFRLRAQKKLLRFGAFARK
jgi:hypothetical protein